MLVTHPRWPQDDPGVPTAFECLADDIHVQLTEANFLHPICVDADSRNVAPTVTRAKREKKTDKEAIQEELDEWFGPKGEVGGTKADEARDLVFLEKETNAKARYEISAFVLSPDGKRIHKQRLVAMLNECPILSNDRLTRIAEGTRYGDKDVEPSFDAGSGGDTAIRLGARVFVLCYNKKTKEHRIWVGRVQKMGRKVKKRSYEYHNPVLVERIPSGGYIYCHWYGRVPNCQNKFLY